MLKAKKEVLDQRCNVPFIHLDAVKCISAASLICPAVKVHLMKFSEFHDVSAVCLCNSGNSW